ncbi:E3 ubiquitin-protein ligase TRIM39-like [Pelobates fuscus]|uniref:E3 ubiquitin-protein ligase TRIM39-like n=1 Tax=Pelobates fuscus TaxID=191477 RepID=UPI002FE43709
MASTDLREELNCSVCLNIYTDPVMLSCGHNFCRACIGSVLDTQEGAGVYTCPDCRAEFHERPALQRNMKLRNIAEQFSIQSEESAICCIYCVHAPVPAVKTCLQCETSLCEIHLVAHDKFLEHVLTEPTAFTENKKCSVHNEALKYYCCTDAVCVCVSCCLAGEHKKHDVELLSEASEKKKEDLRNIVKKLKSRKRKSEKIDHTLPVLQGEVKDKVAGITGQVVTLLKDLRERLEALEKRVLSEISRQEEKILLQISALTKQQEMEREELTGKIINIEKLCNTTDPITVLQGWKIHRADNDTKDEEQKEGEKEEENNDDDEEEVPALGSIDEDLIFVTLFSGLADITAEIKKRSHIEDLLLDIKTASNATAISSDLKTAYLSELAQSYPETPERFVEYNQVLGIGSISTGRHYWEVEVSESGNWDIGVAYPSIARKGSESGVGLNKKSWTLSKEDEFFYCVHDSKLFQFCIESSLRKVGVYVDYEAGRMCFYQLGDVIIHIHTFTATFTEPIHAVFYLFDGAWIRIRSK